MIMNQNAWIEAKMFQGNLKTTFSVHHRSSIPPCETKMLLLTLGWSERAKAGKKMFDFASSKQFLASSVHKYLWSRWHLSV